MALNDDTINTKMQPSEVENNTKLDMKLVLKSEEIVDRGELFPLNCQLNKVEILCFLHGIVRRAFLNVASDL